MGRKLIVKTVVFGAVLLAASGLALAQGDVNKRLQEQEKQLKVQQQLMEIMQKKLEQLEKATKDATVTKQDLDKLRLEIDAAAKKYAQNVALPESLRDLKFYGDLRLRFHGIYGAGSRARNQGRFRLRFGFKKTWLEKQLEVVFRLATGSDENPTSTNQTFDDNFDEKPVWVDRAYARYSPNAIKGLTIIGGKMANPFVHTDLVWDSDVNPEGVWVIYKVPGLGNVEPFIGAGYFQLVHNKAAPDSTLVVYELGTNTKVTKDIKWTLALTYYDFDRHAMNYTEGKGKAGGNTVVDGALEADEFNVINVTNKVSFKAFGHPMSVYADFVTNCGDEVTGKDNGFAIGYKVGQNKKKGDCSAFYKYARIEANSTPGGFNDGDFG
ncbi:MAG: putative porin, partial [Phycisphaerae bacterium]|nr:putative porin [Phycisphaerae bacterium]